VFEQLKKRSRPNEASSGLNGHRGHTIPVAMLLILVVLISAGSGVYAGASFFAQQGANVTVTTTIYTTTTSWTTSTIWSTVTEVVQGILTTVEYTTSTSTITMTQPPITPTTVAITQLTATKGAMSRVTVTVKGSLTETYGNPLGGMPVRILFDGVYRLTVTTGSGGSFYYSGSGSSGAHTVTVIFDGNANYASSQASATYYI
jgi:preprotein translocase subunit SecG